MNEVLDGKKALAKIKRVWKEAHGSACAMFYVNGYHSHFLFILWLA